MGLIWPAEMIVEQAVSLIRDERIVHVVLEITGTIAAVIGQVLYVVHYFLLGLENLHRALTSVSS